MKRFALSLLLAICGYVAAAVVGYFLIDYFSSNVHDRGMEAGMTAAFVFGPLGAVVSFIVAFVRIGRSRAARLP